MKYILWIKYRLDCTWWFIRKYKFGFYEAWCMSGKMKDNFDPEYPTPIDDVECEMSYWGE
jgi:hypothetical protein